LIKEKAIMAKKRNTAKNITITAVLAILILSIVGSVLYFNRQTILPELDNRITYVDINNKGTQFVKLSDGQFENDKFICSSDGDGGFSSLDIVGRSLGGASCQTKKDFDRLQVFMNAAFGGETFLFFGNVKLEQEITKLDWKKRNYEFIPDNLNVGVYDIFINGEFAKRISGVNNAKLRFSSSGGSGTNFANWEYIKYVPLETFTIKNDEVWVKEVRGSDYSVADLNWEMIGYHTQIRPATIRDLTAQTEVPAPQIYINLINGLPIAVQPNTVHTFFYKTKWTERLDSSCQGQLDKIEVKIGDKWVCESFVKETPIIQQCQVKSDCAILPECEAQTNLISCNQDTHLCDYAQFSPACKNQLITYQEKVTEIEKTKFVPIPSGTNSFLAFFDNTKSSYDIGEKKLSVSSPSNICPIEDDSTIISSSNCFTSTLFFNGNNYKIENDKEIIVDFGIKIIPSISGQIREMQLKDWSIVIKATLPDDFLEIKGKELGNKFILQNSDDKVIFTITNKLGFGIDGGYTIQTQNLALEGGVILRDETIPLFLKNGDNDVTYSFETKQLGTIVDIIGAFGKVTTDREYRMFSSKDGKQKFLALTKEIVTEIPQDTDKVQPKAEIIEKVIEKEAEEPIVGIKKEFKIPSFAWAILVVAILIISSLIFIKLRKKKSK